MLRSDDSASSKDTLGPKTPTSGEIFIQGDVKLSSLPPPPPPPPPPTNIDATVRLHNPHPGHPIRTSSASAVPSMRSSRNPTVLICPPSIPGTRVSPGAISASNGVVSGGAVGAGTTTLPMRPAPPPVGPLPPPPNRLPRKSSYQVSEHHEGNDVRREARVGIPFMDTTVPPRY